MLRGKTRKRVHRPDFVDGDRYGAGVTVPGGIGDDARRPLRRVGDADGQVTVLVEGNWVHADAPSTRWIVEHDGVKLPENPARAFDDAAVAGSGDEAVGFAEERVIGGVGERSHRTFGGVIAFGISLPLRAGRGVFEVVSAVVLLQPRSFNPSHVGVFVHLAVALPDVIAVEAEKVLRRAGKFAQVIWVERRDKDAADAAAGIIEIGLVVVVNEDVYVESAVPTAGDIRSILPIPDVGERAERVVGLEERAVVAAHVKCAVEFHDVRRDRDVGHALECPVEEVVGNPRAAAGAIHVVFAIVADHGDVAGRGRSGVADHRERIAIAR